MYVKPLYSCDGAQKLGGGKHLDRLLTIPQMAMLPPTNLTASSLVWTKCGNTCTVFDAGSKVEMKKIGTGVDAMSPPKVLSLTSGSFETPKNHGSSLTILWQITCGFSPHCIAPDPADKCFGGMAGG